MFKHVMHPMQDEGVDFWWLDWQQHIFDTEMPKLHNTWWINYCYFSDMERHGDKRPLLYHRWGGLGNHRYQIGFSGDATISWESLEFQPYFTSTASNVLYGYWSHDIGGHLGDSIDPEMYTRWLQYGGFSPVMRTHSSKNGALNKEPWVFTSEYTDAIRKAVRQRYEMAPYIYTMARKGYDEGLALCRPMYYDHPESPEAYSFRSQYMFGDDMLIAPVTKAGVNGFAAVEVWLPEGKWYELHSGTLLDGGKVLTRHFALDEYGIYIKAGSVLPFYSDEVDNLNGNDEDITVVVFPGDEGCFRLYEDAGNDKDYASQHAFTCLSNSWAGNVQTVKIAPREGAYEGMPSQRNFKVKVYASAAPESVKVNGAPVEYEYLAPR
jgi:alpha-glucosidase (family GH31 glycosyl hydrolase)